MPRPFGFQVIVRDAPPLGKRETFTRAGGTVMQDNDGAHGARKEGVMDMTGGIFEVFTGGILQLVMGLLAAIFGVLAQIFGAFSSVG